MHTKNKFLSFIYLYFGLAVLGGFIFQSCNKFLDVNQNPNNPSSSKSEFLLPASQIALSTIVGNNFQIYGGIWSQYWTQSPTASQYRSIDRYILTNAAFDGSWALIYRSTLQNAEDIINNGEKESNAQYAAIAYIIRAYGLQVSTDAFGDVPCSASNQGVANLNPTYDPQKQVYDSILSYIDKAISLIDPESNYLPGNEDLIFGGDMDSWKSFANTLKLKVLLRISSLEPEVAENGIKDLANSIFLDKDAKIDFISAGGNQNPLFSEIVGLGYTQNLVASGTAVKNFNINGDARLFKLYNKLSKEDTIKYIEQGDFAAHSGEDISPPSSLVGALAQDDNSALAPVKFISASESYFLQAEAVARGWMSGDLNSLFKKGIEASFVADGLTVADADTYIAKGSKDVTLGSTAESKIKSIITQKYYAMCGFQNFEAWTEWRRTGYPNFLILSKATTGTNMPQRMLYPNSEITSNINFPGNQTLFTKVWWQNK